MNKREREICIQIYETNKERLNWYMWKYFSWMNPEDVHDVMQETWGILGRNIHEVADWSEPKQWVWLMTVCHNLAVSVQRRQSRFVDWNLVLQEQLTDFGQTFLLEDEVIDKVMAETLLSGLTREERLVLLQKYCSHPVCEEKSDNNVRNCKRYRLRKKLKKLWKDDGWGE